MCVEWVFLLYVYTAHTHTLNTSSLFLFSILRGSFYARTNRRSISILILYIFSPQHTEICSLKKIWKEKEAQGFLLKKRKIEVNRGALARRERCWRKKKKRRKKHPPTDYYTIRRGTWCGILPKPRIPFSSSFCRENRRRRGWRADERTCLTLIDSRPSATCRVLPKHRNWARPNSRTLGKFKLLYRSVSISITIETISPRD